jgi:hypothetical protein
LAHVLRLTLDQAVLLLILVAVDLRTLAAVVLLHTLTVVGPLVSLATRVVLVAVAATLHAMATVIAGGTGTGEVMHITGRQRRRFLFGSQLLLTYSYSRNRRVLVCSDD